MNIEKRKSGSYRVRKTVNGKSISITFDHKPTQSEIFMALADKMNEIEQKEIKEMSFQQACKKYNDSKSNVLSPTTMRSYMKYPELMPEWFTYLPINEIEQIHINKVINELSLNKSPKTIRNYHGYISAVLSTYRPQLNISTTLPQKTKYKPYEPSKDDVKRIMQYFKEHYPNHYVGLYLCACGLRKGEMCALEPTDLDGDVLHITKSKALNYKNEWVIKKPKTTQSERDITIPIEIADLIRSQGFVYKGYPTEINKNLNTAQQKLGIPHFTVHVLRHFFAAVLSETCDESTVLELGGWETAYVMKRAYRYSMALKEDDKKRKAMSNVSNAIL